MIKNTCLHNTVYTTLAGSVSEKWSKASNHHAHDSIHNSNVASRVLMGERGPGAGAGWMKKACLIVGAEGGGVPFLAVISSVDIPRIRLLKTKEA